METEMLYELPPQSENKAKSMQVSNAAQSNSELSSDDFEVPANNLALRQIPFQIMTMHISIYLRSGIVNHYRSCMA